MRDSIKELRGEVERLRRRVEQRPIIQLPTPTYRQRVVVIIDGNTLDTGQDGVLYSPSEVASIPTAYDPNTGGAFIDGIGRATLYIDAVAQTDKVLVVNDTRGSFGAALLTGDRCIAGPPITMPVDSGGFATVYTIG